MLAGISVEYLARLEQGRDRNPSGQVLFALADALRLSPDERHMFANAAQASGGEACSPPPPSRSVRPTVRALLDRFEPTPAIVVNRLSDVVARTAGYERLVGPIGLLDAQRPNLIRFVFTDARARTAYPEWDRIADTLVASFKTETSRTDHYAVQFIERLASNAGAPLTDRLSASPTLSARTSGERLAHPEVGELRLAYDTLTLTDYGEQRMIVYLPDDDATSAALDRLNGQRPGCCTP
jgi:transcriptional regulator with XRE-family HTH domain